MNDLKISIKVCLMTVDLANQLKNVSLRAAQIDYRTETLPIAQVKVEIPCGIHFGYLQEQELRHFAEMFINAANQLATMSAEIKEAQR